MALSREHADLVTLMQFEPFVRQCVRVTESACLSRELECSARGASAGAATPAFQAHLEQHYKPFCRDAIRLMFFCGFVPWRVRKLESGEKVPEALPVGSFRWRVRTSTAEELARGAALLAYEVASCACAAKLADIHVFPMIAPGFSSALHDSPSPMAFCVGAYREYMRARARQCLVEDWNSTPSLVVSHSSKLRVNAGPQTEKVQTKLSGGLFASNARDGADPYVDGYALRNYDIKCMMRENHITADVNLFTLPGDNEMQMLGALPPVEDPDALLRRYQLAVCNVMGVPANMVMPLERQGPSNAGQAAFSVNSRLFGNNVRTVASGLQALLQGAYKEIYAAECEFRLTPVAKMEIQTFEELECAVRSGAVNMEMLANIAHSIGTDFPPPRYAQPLRDYIRHAAGRSAHSAALPGHEHLRI